MAIQLKYMYNPAYFEKLCPVLEEAIPGFDSRDFIFRIFNNDWPDKELKERVRHITHVLHAFLPGDFRLASQQLKLISNMLRLRFRRHSFENIFLADYVQVYGIRHPEESLDALAEITKLVSAEYAVRPFMIRYPEATMSRFDQWSRS